ncbi:hypothetical protein CMI42_00410 [Candidatus Pacearchaeota archaeon]|nr:hypothetical protein [Candidatus Pacearchaeota archaeon]|tara:strand:+ start:543 stop:1139 length:597 start_codon:yes stop_codon:yes gene_type:complete
MRKQKRSLTALKQKDGKTKEYRNYEENNFAIDEEIIGLDSNVLVDLVNSEEFKDDLKAEVTFNILKIYTTELALSEARNVLISKKRYNREDATNGLLDILKEFDIEKISHTDSADKTGSGWVNKIKSEMRIKKFSTFPNDCKIISNLFIQKKINVYYTEDKDIEKAINILGIDLKVRILPEATNLSTKKTSKFFREKR